MIGQFSKQWEDKIVSSSYMDFASLLGTTSPECNELLRTLGPHGELMQRPTDLRPRRCLPPRNRISA